MAPMNTEKKPEATPVKPVDNSPWAGIASTWGGHQETPKPAEIGIVGFKDEPQTIVPTPPVRSAWDNDDDDI